MTTYLVRHGSAGSRNSADPADHERPLDEVGLVQARKLTDWLRHVHISDKTRVPPGESGANDDYKSVFRVLKEGKYPGLISVEAGGFDIPTMGKRVLEFVKKQWNEA